MHFRDIILIIFTIKSTNKQNIGIYAKIEILSYI